jgi:hypothetical protein
MIASWAHHQHCIGEGAHGGKWCGAPPLVWVELVPLAFWLVVLLAVVDVL